MKTKIRITFTEEVLGTASGDPDVHRDYIASKGPDAASIEEEVEAVGVDEVIDKAKTIFPRDDDGNPIFWDYQIKGFFKDACSMLGRVKGTKSSELTAYKKIIDGLVFVTPRKISVVMSGEMGNCQRPLRAQTAKGERIALAHSETIPAGSYIDVEITTFDLKTKTTAKTKDKPVKKSPTLIDCVTEWLEYGALRGIGQWRNSGKGRFEFEVIG